MKQYVGVVLLCALAVCGAGPVSAQEGLDQKVRRLEQRVAELEALLKKAVPAKEEAAPAAAAAVQPAPAAAPAGGSGKNGLLWSASLDGYYGYNFNRPVGRANQLRNFDVSGSQFNLNYGELVLERPAEPVGFRLDLGFGQAADIVHATEPGSQSLWRHVQQAFVTYKAPVGKGLQLDFGKFVTGLGAEVIETRDNYNYSRSLLFAYAIPYYHFGLRATYPVAEKLTLGGMIVNGWNNVTDNNTAKTYHGIVIFSPHKRVTITQNVITGPERADSNRGWRTVFDSVVSVTATDKLTLLGNYDYGQDRPDGVQRAHWTGVAGAFRYSPSKWFSIAPRLEWFNDADGFATGAAQRLKEGTLTAEFRLHESLATRLEYRRDWSNQPFFDRRGRPASAREQNTILGGLFFYFAAPR